MAAAGKIKINTNLYQEDFIRLAYPLFTKKAISQTIHCSISKIEKYGHKHGLKTYKDYDYTNLRFGKLIAVQRNKTKQKNNYIYKCLCDCGKYINVRSSLLYNNIVKSCGCQTKSGLSHYRRGGHKEISGYVWSKIISHAKERGITFDLTIEDAYKILEKQGFKCWLSGLELKFKQYHSGSDTETTASLDRIDSKKHYIIDNVRWVHKKINFMKHTMSEQEFIELCRLVANNRGEII